MPKVQVKFDNTLTQSDIIIPLINSSPDEAGDNYENNQPMIQQTSVYGIQAPLISVNNIVVDVTDVVSFSLDGGGRTPSVDMVIKDRYNLIKSLDTPGIDNELRVQILPQFDGKYKKINLTFYITDTRFNDNQISISGSYKLPKLTNTQIKSFGEINTYKLFEMVAQETGLGFASNVEEGDQDKRYVYCDYKSYIELLGTEISRSGYDIKIYDWWIDWWNNLVLVDVYDRYNNIDPDEDLKIWVSHQIKEMEEGIKHDPEEIVAVLTNNPMMQSNELFVQSYHISNSPGSQMGSGTDKVYSAYDIIKGEYEDTLIQDGDTKKDIFLNFEYLGESYSEYNYLLSQKKREAFFQKINSNETVEVVLRTPLLGVMRGNKINFTCYANNSIVDGQRESLKNNGVISDIQTNVPMDDSQVESQANDGEFVVDKSVSGQYMISDVEINFRDMKWEYVVTLSRPASQKPKQINEE